MTYPSSPSPSPSGSDRTGARTPNQIHRHTLRWSLVALCGAALAAPSVAQDGTAPPDATPGSPEQVQQAEEILPRMGTNQTPVMPTKPAESNPVQPGLTGGQDWLRVLHETLETEIAPSTLAEGAFVMGRDGDLVSAPSGLLIFVPDRESREPGEGPVLLMPSRALEQLLLEWTGQSVEISGEIFTYHGRNQLLLSSYRLIAQTQSEPEPEDQQTTTPSTPRGDEEPEPDAPSLEDDPAVRDLLKELEQGLTPGKTIPAQAGNDGPDALRSRAVLPRSPVSVNEQATPGLEEGTLILRRPSRMTRNAQGAWTLVFDNDNDNTSTDATTPRATELIVLPCRTLMKMETAAMQAGDAARLLVSGRVYTYQGNAYLMPTLVQRISPSEINPLQ